MADKPRVLYHSPDAAKCGIYENGTLIQFTDASELSDDLLKQYLRMLTNNAEQNIDFLAARHPLDIGADFVLKNRHQYY